MADAGGAGRDKRSMMAPSLTSPLLMRRPSLPPGLGTSRRAALAAVAVGTALLFCIAAASVWQADANQRSLSQAEALRQQLAVASGLLLAVREAETGQRGFLLTLDPAYLTPMVRSEAALPDLLDRLSAARPSDERVTELRRTVETKLAELQRTVALAKAGQLDAALALVRGNSGLAEMRVIRTLALALAAELDARLAKRVAAVNRGGQRLVGIDVAGLAMVAGLAGLIANGVRRAMAELREAQRLTSQAYEALERNNEQLDEAVRARTADLTAANDEIQRFAYIVSHDLRAPLVNVMGFTGELEQAAATLAGYAGAGGAPAEVQAAASEDIPEALRFIKSSTVKMDRLINAILQLSREGRRVLTAERLDMGAVFANMADSMAHQASSKGAEVAIGPVPDLVGDRLAVEQVFGNVIDNALKYLQPGRPGLIRIEGRREAGMARFEISDNGRGIAPKDFERVFELFRRAGDQAVPGEGIGLAHVRALLRRLGGTIECQSALGVGTTFTIRLPAVAAGVKAAA